MGMLCKLYQGKDLKTFHHVAQTNLNQKIAVPNKSSSVAAKPRSAIAIPWIDQAVELCHRLFLLVTPTGTRKITVIQAFLGRTERLSLNANFEMSRRLIATAKGLTQ